ncbi:MAG TPA: hypothetical protein VFZ78_03175 [Flavisolibacter sp.]
MRPIFVAAIILISVVAFVACRRDPAVQDPGGNTTGFSYPDSTYYLKSDTYSIPVTNNKTGTYAVFPQEGLEVHPTTGLITIRNNDIAGPTTETGLRYRITFTPSGGGAPEVRYINIGGINYTDVIFYTSDASAKIRPIYNSNRNLSLPAATFSARREGGTEPCPINPVTGEIDMKEVLSSNFLRETQSQEERNVIVTYTLDDASNKIQQNVLVRLYWYENSTRLAQDGNLPKDIASNAAQVLMVGEPDPPMATLQQFKPRPPCIVIVGD